MSGCERVVPFHCSPGTYCSYVHHPRNRQRQRSTARCGRCLRTRSYFRAFSPLESFLSSLHQVLVPVVNNEDNKQPFATQESCHIVPYHVISCNAMPYHTISCHTMSYRAIPCHAVPYHAIPCHAMPYHPIPCHTVPYHAIPPKPRGVKLCYQWPSTDSVGAQQLEYSDDAVESVP